MFIIGGAGLPVGVPPLPEDPATTNVAPEKCLFYFSSAGMAQADPQSDNQTEQLFAEPQVRRMAAEIERAVREGFQKVAERGELPPNVSPDAIVDLAKVILTRPLAVYVSDVQMHPGGPIVRGGIVVNCGDGAKKVQAALDRFVEGMPPQLLKEVEIAGAKWKSFQATPNLTIVWGFKGRLLPRRHGRRRG